jgi:hypothetical protein
MFVSIFKLLTFVNSIAIYFKYLQIMNLLTEVPQTNVLVTVVVVDPGIIIPGAIGICIPGCIIGIPGCIIGIPGCIIGIPGLCI